MLKALGTWLDNQTHFQVPGPETGFHLEMPASPQRSILERTKKLVEEFARYRAEMPQVMLYYFPHGKQG